ncbi:Vacuolar protein sorting/targeting protein 10 [Thelohanellus kitauei]|uniref:Vacuolar protein sorting/targeting protein 10 n=1 Tax=Thelohanellus kitauei TaxID=669202 RepID=A0A0C2J6L6_THEKT|nr:Vacuolar protein sorting/targeting protein 10 [Thelohanellus kitauei]
MQPIPDTTFNLSIIDIERKTHNPIFFPSILKILNVKLFQYAFGNYYLVLLYQDLTMCLWTTSPKPFHFVKKLCVSGHSNSTLESNFYIDQWAEGQIYFNLPWKGNQLVTHRTTDDGRYWDVVKFKHFSLDNEEPVCFNFELHDPNSVPQHFGFVDFQYEKSNNALQPYMTIDGGNSWDPTPKSASKILLLNYETVAISIDHDLSGINYSLDKGTSWLNHKLWPSNSTLHYFGKLSDSDLRILIINRNSETNKLRFDVIDFSNIFKFECKNHDFNQVRIPKSRGFCYRGKILDLITRNADIRCINKLGPTMYMDRSCPCSAEDWGCPFNFQPKGDVCVVDPLANISREPFKCENGSHPDISQLGYISLAADTCEPHEMNKYLNVSDKSQCIPNSSPICN